MTRRAITDHPERRADAPCGCCGGTRQVLDMLGQPRPCSRCDAGGFDQWQAARRPHGVDAEPKP